MPVDMKETIAQAAHRLLTQKQVKKLTVKDIVEECQITRQAFYYHFADIPELVAWVLERESDRMLQKTQDLDDLEEGLRYFLQMAINAAPYVKKGMNGSYRDELERLLTQYMMRFFERVIEAEGLFPSRTRWELKLILRYHTQAILGLLREWTDEDTKQLDQIAHQIYLMMGQVSPLE